MTQDPPKRPTLSLKAGKTVRKPAAKQKPRGQAPRSWIKPLGQDPRPTDRSDAPPSNDSTRPSTHASPPSAARPPARTTPRNANLSQRARLSGTDSRPPGLERLNKKLAALGHCSRREADEWIAKGWVRVNNEVAAMGQLVGPQDEIQILRRAHTAQAERVTFLLHKPVGYVSGQPEDGHASAAELLGRDTQWARGSSWPALAPRRVRGSAPAGRLDIDSTGLLVLTQDGRVARQLIGEDSEVEKEYLVRVHWIQAPNGVVTEDVQSVFPTSSLAMLRHGLSLDGQALRPAEVEWQNPEQLKFILREGKKRQIRRMCEAVGLKVVGLKRVRIGRITLGDLPLGQWRLLGADERF